MTPRELREHKLADKKLDAIPQFKLLKKNKLPKPFSRMGGSRVFASPLINLSDVHAALFMWRNGEILTDTAFLAFMVLRLPSGDLSPLFEFHWHPSHKGFHCKTPCGTHLDYTNRMLPGAPELELKTDAFADPRKDSDRLKLMQKFCDSCGISLALPDDGSQQQLWNS